jgi:putative transposase
MGKKHFTEEQIAFALRQAESRLGGRSNPQARDQRADLLAMEEAVRRARHCRVATASDLGGGEQEAQAAGCRPEPRQEDAAGRALKKTLRPAVKRVLVREVRVCYQVAVRRACRALGFARSSFRYKSRRNQRAELRVRLRDLAASRVHYGYQRLWVLLRREGWGVNKKLAYRLYCEEGLGIRRRKPRRRKSVQVREARPPTGQTNESWSMDFMADQLVGGQRFRLLTLVDNHSRESLAIEAGQRLTGDDVVRVLERVSSTRGKPQSIRVDNGPEFISRSLDLWAYFNGVKLDFSRPGKPTDNAVIESFNGRLRDECLNQHWFLSLDEARAVTEAWRDDYNRVRPHGALGNRTPSEFARPVAGHAQLPALHG